MADTNKLDQSTTVSRPCIILSPIHTPICQCCKAIECTDAKNTPFTWSSECEAFFNTLKQKLMQAPILAFPSFHRNVSPFVLETDASSAVGLNPVLEQDGHVIAYASRSLSSAQQHYSVI